jgi:hypothetical protein
MSNKSYGNGVFVKETRFPEIQLGHLDAAHVFAMNRKGAEVTHLGQLTPFMLSGYLKHKPMFGDMLSPTSIREVDASGQGTFTWSTAVAPKECYFVEDLSGSPTPGIDGEPFKIRLSKYLSGKTSVIKFSEFSDVELYVLDYEKFGDFWDYTVQILSPDAKHKYLPKHYMRAGQRVFSSTSYGAGEYGNVYNSINGDISGMGSAGERLYQNFVGTATANVHYSVTREGAYSSVEGSVVKKLSDFEQMLSVYEFQPNSLGWKNKNGSITPFELYSEANRGKSDAYVLDVMKRDILRQSVIPKIEYIARMQIMADVRQSGMFAVGGRVGQDGATSTFAGVGLWWQMQKGNIYSYNIEDFSLEMLEGYIKSLYKSKVVPYELEGAKPTITFKCGIGIIEIIKKLIRDRYHNQGLMVEEKTYVSGSLDHKLVLTSPDFIGYDDFPYAKIRFELETAFSPKTSTMDVDNPTVATRYGGEPLSAYTIMCADLSGEGNNIVEVRKRNYWESAHYVEQGKLQYPLQGGIAGVPNTPFLTSNVKNAGFTVYMEQPHVAYQMIDPSKVFILRPFNPITGKPLFASYFK